MEQAAKTDPNTTDSSKIPQQPEHLIQSSSIQGYSYDSQSYQLTVWFKGKATPVYKYFNVFPNVVSDIFDLPGSVGLRLRHSLKGIMFQRLK